MNDKLVEYEEYYKAIEDSSKAITLDPDNAAAFYRRGVAYRCLARSLRALQDFNRVIELRPDNAAAFYSRGEIHDTLG